MNIRMNQTRRGRTTFDVLCDLCGEPVSLNETIHYLTPRSPKKGNDLIAHSQCGRTKTVPGHWTQLHRVRWLLEQLLKQNHDRHPTLLAFLATLPNQEKDY
ncbi:MAG: hypothetical protein QM785_18960 [Pyrinomonadaceae bacterium]